VDPEMMDEEPVVRVVDPIANSGMRPAISISENLGHFSVRA
jgi:hypothetical protein